MNHEEAKRLAQINDAEILLDIIADEAPLASIFGMLAIITYTGETVRAFNPQSMLDKISVLQSNNKFKEELKSIINDGFENMLKFSEVFKSVDKRIITLYADIEAGNYNNERGQDNGSSDRDSTGANPVS